jgi:hypothetical protein
MTQDYRLYSKSGLLVATFDTLASAKAAQATRAARGVTLRLMLATTTLVEVKDRPALKIVRKA